MEKKKKKRIKRKQKRGKNIPKGVLSSVGSRPELHSGSVNVSLEENCCGFNSGLSLWFQWYGFSGLH